MNHVKQSVDHEEAAMLLPWYVNDTLDEAERRRVEEHIESCARCRDDVDLLADVRRAVRNGSPAPLVPSRDEERLLAALDRSGRRATRRAWPLLAAAAAVAAVAILIAWQAGSRPSTTPVYFETATSPDVTATMNYVLEVRFMPDTAAESHTAFFESIGAAELAVPVGDHIYRVTLGLGPVTLAELERFADDVTSRPEIAAARFVAVQLPVE